ncbi:hypothetical protein, partial [Escherichia coli]|uniref:hypothetical protein n=1 Tax=Escherichia coli TaxID=562 RepID=UPI001A901173
KLKFQRRKMGSSSKALLFVFLSLAILSMIITSQGAKLLPEIADNVNGNKNIEPQGFGRHLVKGLGKIVKAGKAIYCNRCKECKGVCGRYCCR